MTRNCQNTAKRLGMARLSSIVNRKAATMATAVTPANQAHIIGRL